MYSIFTPNAPVPDGAYSQGSSAARYVFVSAQLPRDPASGEMLDGSVGAQAALCVRSMEGVLAEVDLGLEDICAMTLYLTSLADQRAVDEVLAERLPKPWPARSCVAVAELPQGAKVQMDCVACR